VGMLHFHFVSEFCHQLRISTYSDKRDRVLVLWQLT